jgi:hypothetical protein
VENILLHTRHFLSRHKYARGKCFAAHAPLFIAPQIHSWKMFPFTRATFYRATYMLVENASLHTRHFLSRYKYARGKCFPSHAPLFIAPQTRSWKMFPFTLATFYCATNTLVENASLHTRHFLSRHRIAREKCFAAPAPLFITPQTRSWKMLHCTRATFYRATESLLEKDTNSPQHKLLRSLAWVSLHPM